MDLKSLEPILQKFMSSLEGKKLVSSNTSNKNSKDSLKSSIPSFTFDVSPQNISPQEAQSLYSISPKIVGTNFLRDKDLFKTKYFYEIVGKVIDNNTSNPIEGVKVQLSFREQNNIFLPAPSPLTLQKSLPQVYSITEVSTQEIQNPPYTTYVVPQYVESKKILTDKNGKFKILINLPTIPLNQKVPLFWGLTFTKNGNIPTTIPIMNGDNTIKSDLPIIPLTNIKVAAKSAVKDYILSLDEVQNKVQNIVLDPADKVIAFKRKNINNLVDITKTRLIPLAIELLISFGITKINQSNQKTCPTPEVLEEIIRKRNSVVRQLNQIYQSIAINTALAGAFFILSKKVKVTIDSLPIPLLPQTYTIIGKLQQISDIITELSEQNKELNKNILSALVYLVSGITVILILLSVIDKLTQECAEEGGSTLPEQLAIDQELLNLTQKAEEDGNPVVKSVNGFILSVETDNKNLVGTLKRRFAVAKNKQGIIALRGESSFSSNDQILIDELVFYIQQNNLKTF